VLAGNCQTVQEDLPELRNIQEKLNFISTAVTASTSAIEYISLGNFSLYIMTSNKSPIVW